MMEQPPRGDGTSSPLPQVTVIAKNLTYWPRRGARIGNAPILDSVNLIAKPGRVLGILGASGSGKTTLLNLLAGNSTRQGLTGSVRFVGSDVTVVPPAKPVACFPQPYAQSKGGFCLGYVTATSIFPAGLSIREVVLYVARIHAAGRGRHQSSQQEIEEATASALDSVGLSDLRLQAAVAEAASPAHRKRLALALEHLRDPAVILLDEPTSGLDVKQSSRIIQMLKERAQQRGETIICTIHQPRTSTLLLFDEILLLTNLGRVAYFGPPSELQAYLASRGYVLPSHDSLACFALEVVSNPNASVSMSSTPPTSLSMQRTPSRNLTELRKSKGTSRTGPSLANAFSDSLEARRLREEIKVYGTYSPVEPCVMAGSGRWECFGWMQQMIILLWRMMLCRWRVPLVTVGVVICAFVEALLIGLVFLRLPKYINGYHPIQVQTSVQQAVQELNGSQWTNVLLNGFNDEGYQPLLELIDYGINGRGRSVVQSLLESPLFLPTIVNATDFMYSEFNLTGLGYPKVESYTEDGDLPLTPSSGTAQGAHEKGGDIDLEAYVAEGSRVAAKALQLIDYFYYRYHWASFNVCQKYWGSTKYNLCVYLELRDIIGAITKFINWPFPTEMLQMLANLDNEPDWPKYGPSRRRRLQDDINGTTSVTAQEWSSEASGFLDEYGLRPVVKCTFGSDLLSLIDPVTQWIETLWVKCTHPLCKHFPPGEDSPLAALYNTTATFLEQSYTTMGTLLNLCGVMFFICLLLGFASYESLLTFPSERVFLNREVAGGRCRRSSYFLAKMFADLPVILFVGTIVSITLYFLTGFQMVGDRPTAQVLVFWAISLLVAFAAHGFAYVISAASPTAEMGLLLAPLFLLIWLTIAGFFLRSNELPKWIKWFNVLSFYHWGFNAQMGNLLPEGGSFGNLPNALNRGFAGISEGSVSLCCVYLAVLGIAYRILAFILLSFFHRNVGVEG